MTSRTNRPWRIDEHRPLDRSDLPGFAVMFLWAIAAVIGAWIAWPFIQAFVS